MGSYCIFITKKITKYSRGFTGLRFALTTVMKGKPCHLFLMNDSVENAKKTMASCNDEDLQEICEWIETYFEEGGQLYACMEYCKDHEIKQEDLLRFVPITSIKDAVEISDNAEHILTF